MRRRSPTAIARLASNDGARGGTGAAIPAVRSDRQSPPCGSARGVSSKRDQLRPAELIGFGLCSGSPRRHAERLEAARRRATSALAVPSATIGNPQPVAELNTDLAGGMRDLCRRVAPGHDQCVSRVTRHTKGWSSRALHSPNTARAHSRPRSEFYFQTQKMKYPSDIETKPPARAT